MTRLVVVSNRVALPNELKPGGLAHAMRSALREIGGIWFGWSGRTTSQTASMAQIQREGNVTFATLDLGKRDHEEYYAGFANRTLWPLFHFRPSLVDFTRQTWAAYRRVNAIFAEHLARFIEPDDLVWIHDYHLIPLASLLRERGIRARLGFFLHTPFPPPELLNMLPVHRELFEALADYDLVGFHTADYLRAFRDYILLEAHGEVNDTGVISVRGGRRSFRAGVFPIGIDVPEVSNLAAAAHAHPGCAQLHESLQGRALMIGVDRLDYSKGLPERFRAFGRLLEEYPEFKRQVTFLQIAPVSRTEVAEYRQLKRELERIAGGINGRFAEPDWTPVRYLNNAYPHAALTGYYRQARVGLVTPLRDGMNLVAKEYVASQDGDDPGVLVLSRFAGAARQMGGAILVNPHDQDGMVNAMRAAITMPLADRRARWRELMDGLEREDITAWRRSFLAALDVTAEARDGRLAGLAA
ncbi:alpha,alpha-trehalose-phosphate synthase (UDP-forming) [Tahibacter amnicola]|uniref:Trehalose-6-phosphate synthase n=1 Tax=Tahibacter amnicola TaxID=2976241 RepID=A0ABY6BAH6_9GAMM|nr:alpha,alpha-trehalose-phosphate synthase (UDP-forming) [Tahibacter amnicola]UXI66532.1 alpha,alpha-trehalose-phosphate synthase (UDP-forming) [Tahibacter amnicola]